jgi:DNA polymerase V
MTEWVALIDCNNFFVSCERLFRPDLKKRPVVVLSANDGCVVARSQEIKDKGIPMGVPHFQVKDILKDIRATTFSSNFTLYRDISRRVFEVVRDEIPDMEQYSIDEAFFILKGRKEEVEVQARKLKDRIEREVGIPVSVGVAGSKTLAKYANNVAKKTNGIHVLDMDDWSLIQNSIQLSTLWGVGKSTSDSFKRHVLLSAGDFCRLDRQKAKDLFGVAGERLWYELHGIQTTGLQRRLEHQKSILHSRSFKAVTSDLAVLKDAVAYHVREAAEDLRSMQLKAGFLQVYVGTSRHGDYFLEGGSLSVTLPIPTNDTFVFLKSAMQLVDTLYKPDVPYKKAGVLLTNFSPETVSQLTMFEAKETEKTSTLMPVLDAVNQSLGRGSVLIGSRLRVGEWTSSKESRSPAYTTAWSGLQTVKA